MFNWVVWSTSGDGMRFVALNISVGWRWMLVRSVGDTNSTVDVWTSAPAFIAALVKGDEVTK